MSEEEQTYKDACDEVLLKRAQTSENSIKVCDKNDSRDMRKYKIFKLHYEARVSKGYSVEDHPFLSMTKPEK